MGPADERPRRRSARSAPVAADAAVRPPVAGGAVPEERGLVLAGDDEVVRAKLAEVRYADYFAVLDLDPDGPLLDGAVEASYERMCRRFDPARYVGRAALDLEDVLAEIRAGLDDAREVLADRLLRERYRRAIRA